jgi:para-nitrobenzyl esterase
VERLRWKPPQHAAKWAGVRNAGQFGNACSQQELPDGQPTSEDCLYLNVWTPAKSAQDRLPVMFWIHGGGLRSGAGTMIHYDGEALAKRGVLLVTINYRLGWLGYFAHPELTRESERKVSGNYGLLDQIAALQWVQKNIAAFGGDPNKVTVFGQSGGSRSANALVASPLAKGLFRGVIAESHTLFPKALSLAEAEKAGVAFAESKGCTSLAQLRAKPAAELVKGTEAVGYSPNVDGWVLPADPYTVFIQGKQNNVSLLAGSNADDAQGPPPSFKAQTFLAQARRNFGDRAGSFLEFYPAGSDAEARKSAKESACDQERAKMRTWVRLATRTGKSKAYWYEFTRVPPMPPGDMPAPRWGSSELFGKGAFHGAEIAYVFQTLRTKSWPWTETDFTLSDTIAAYWTNFAKTGDPNGNGLPEWPAYDAGSDLEMELGETVAQRPAPHKAALDFYEAHFAKINGH